MLNIGIEMQRLVLLTFFLSSSVLALEWDIRGQASAWNNSTLDKLGETLIGLRYIPELSLTHSLSQNSLIDADISVNALGSYDVGGQNGETEISPYRVWLRYSGSQFEARLGLQQIKFGPAMILRSLMWFDQIDPRDPLQITRGVPAALFRYYFLNNANVWVWGVLGDDKTKGLEVVPSAKNSFEFGGRAQLPVGPGELALTYHHRMADLRPFLDKLPYLTPLSYSINLDPIPENRYAVDGRWDMGIGLWFESALVHKEVDIVQLDYQKYLTIGADYTFGLGNGLHLAGEHLMFDVSGELTERGKSSEFSALMAGYNFSLWDMGMALFYYSWETQELYNFFTWRRTFDTISFNVSLFWNPKTPIRGATDSASSFGAGKGFQFMLIFNH